MFSHSLSLSRIKTFAVNHFDSLVVVYSQCDSTYRKCCIVAWQCFSLTFLHYCYRFTFIVFKYALLLFISNFSQDSIVYFFIIFTFVFDSFFLLSSYVLGMYVMFIVWNWLHIRNGETENWLHHPFDDSTRMGQQSLAHSHWTMFYGIVWYSYFFISAMAGKKKCSAQELPESTIRFFLLLITLLIDQKWFTVLNDIHDSPHTHTHTMVHGMGTDWGID